MKTTSPLIIPNNDKQYLSKNFRASRVKLILNLLFLVSLAVLANFMNGAPNTDGKLLKSTIHSVEVNNTLAEQKRTGHILFRNQLGAFTAVLDKNHHLRINNNTEQLATTLVQEFINTTNQVQDGVYLYSLPPNTQVRRLKMLIGDKSIEKDILNDSESLNQNPTTFSEEFEQLAPNDKIWIQLELVQYKSKQLNTLAYMPGIENKKARQSRELFYF